jgi:outer membrane protein assembly factor BamB
LAGVASFHLLFPYLLPYCLLETPMRCLGFLLAAAVTTAIAAHADDGWPRFRGPSGLGVTTSATPLPTTWSAEANLAWKTPLPGPGASSPIIVGDRVFVTCYSGYGLTQEDPGDINKLIRHLICVDLKTGEQLWQADVKAALPEDPYSGIGVTAHGYASHTPVSDGERVYAFFGKSGVHAFDLAGAPLWQADVGMESDPTRWGSSSSPIVHDGTVIVTASAESQSIIGLDAKTGKEVWRQEAAGLDGMWGTPTLIAIDDSRTDLVMCVTRELWGLDPASGKLRWFAKATDAEHAYASAIFDGTRVFAFTGRGGGSVAVDAGGTGDVTSTNTIWSGGDTTAFASAVQHNTGIYLVARNILTRIDAETGKRIGQTRLQGARATGGRFGSLDYPSPIVVNDRLYSLNGSGQMFVFDLSPDGPSQVAVNELTSDGEEFRGTPAVSDGRLVMRSSGHLYCVVDKGETVDVSVAVADTEADEPDAGNPPGGPGGRGRPGQQAGEGPGRFDPESLFTRFDTDSSGSVSAKELEGNPMADRLMTLDSNSDGEVSREEFRSGMANLFRRVGGEGGGGRGGEGPGRGERQDSRPERPQRPEMAG